MLYYDLEKGTNAYLGTPGMPARIVRGKEWLPDLVGVFPNPRKWMVPANATTVAPPELPNGHVAVFTGDRWQGSYELVESHRGKTVYLTADRLDGEVVVGAAGQEDKIADLGPLPDDVTETAPGPNQVWDAQAGAWADDPVQVARAYDDAVNMERARRIVEGCVVTVTGVGAVPVQGRQEDKDSFTNLCNAAQLRLAAGDSVGPMVFRDAADAIHEMTPVEMLELYGHAMAFAEAVYRASWAIKDTTRPEDPTDDAHWPAPVWPQL